MANHRVEILDAKKDAMHPLVAGLARLLDEAIPVPGTSARIGIDGLLGLIPGVGDAISAGLGLLLIGEARRLGASQATQLRMLGNLMLDLSVGIIPILGDLFDFTFKANTRNLAILRKHLANRDPSTNYSSRRPLTFRGLLHWLKSRPSLR